MLSGFSLAFCSLIGLITLFFGLVWNAGDRINIGIKTLNVFLCACSLYTALYCDHLSSFFLTAVATWLFVGAMLWGTNSRADTIIKIIFSLGWIAMLTTAIFNTSHHSNSLDNHHHSNSLDNHHQKK